MDDSEARRSQENWIFDPSLAAIDRQLRRELREEAEEVESIVAESELREQLLTDIASDARNRGDVVGIGGSKRVFTGVITYVARDIITLLAESYEADINVMDISYIRTIQQGRSRGGLRPVEGGGTFEMRLLERRSPRDQVEIGFRWRDETIIGHITVVAQDHLTLVDQNRQEWHIPLRAISFVWRERQRPRR